MAKFNWDKLLHTSWLYTKVFFVVLALMVGSYFYGTYNPNGNTEWSSPFATKNDATEGDLWDAHKNNCESSRTHCLPNNHKNLNKNMVEVQDDVRSVGRICFHDITA